MGQLLTPETFEFFARYLLPGFVFLAARSRYVLGEGPKPAETLIEALILSLINQLIFLVLMGLIPQLASSHGPTALLVLEVVVLPTVTGNLVGWLLEKNLVPGPLRKLFMPFTRPVTFASEHAFARLTKPVFMIITYSDDREIFGYFGSTSLASSDLANGGLYLERLYSVDEAGLWVETAPSRRAWISLAGARSIEFLDPDGGE